jgi:hypothetical protein
MSSPRASTAVCLTIFAMLTVLFSVPALKVNFCPAKHFRWVQRGVDLGDRCLWNVERWRFWCEKSDYFNSCYRDRRRAA